MRTTYIAGNWKMNKNYEEFRFFWNEYSVLRSVSGIVESSMSGVKVVVSPPSLYLIESVQKGRTQQVMIAAQNCNENESGAFTGEISPSMLQSVGVEACIIGHSERRAYYHETDVIINAKLRQLLAHAILPIVCVGETLSQRESGATKEIVLSQLAGCFDTIEWGTNTDIVIAYEPVWAIGTGKTASPRQAQEVHALIRKWLVEHYGNDVAQRTSILYGGSVKPSNLAELLIEKDIDGGLIGGASLAAQDFIDMIHIASNL